MRIYKSDKKKNAEIDKTKDTKCINCGGIMEWKIQEEII